MKVLIIFLLQILIMSGCSGSKEAVNLMPSPPSRIYDIPFEQALNHLNREYNRFTTDLRKPKVEEKLQQSKNKQKKWKRTSYLTIGGIGLVGSLSSALELGTTGVKMTAAVTVVGAFIQYAANNDDLNNTIINCTEILKVQATRIEPYKLKWEREFLRYSSDSNIPKEVLDGFYDETSSLNVELSNLKGKCL